MVVKANWLYFCCLSIGIVFMIGADFPVMAIAPQYPETPEPEAPVINRQTLPLALENIEQRVRGVTVRVTASQKALSGVSVKNAGSGILIGRQKGAYFVITNSHVVKAATDIQVGTSDDKFHTATLVNSVNFQSIDLVLLSFQSSAVYPTARLGRTSDLKIGDWVFATGFPRRSQTWKFAEGQYALAAPKTMESGYAFGYSSEVESGMSGGAVVDAYGRVIAVNGFHARPLWGKPSYLYNNGEKPCEPIRQEMANLSWAIPMETVIQFMPNLRVATLETVKTNGTFPTPFATNHPSPEFWQWRASYLNKCAAVPLPPLVNLVWTNAVLPPVTFAPKSVYPQVYREDYMSESDFLKFDRRSLTTVALTFSFTLVSTIASPLIPNVSAIAEIPEPQPVKINSEDAPAIAQTTQSVRVNSEADQMARAQISLSQAQGFFEQGLYDRAKIMVNQAIDLNPNSPLAWQLLGNCLKKLGRDQEALSAYDQAIKLLSVAKDNAIAPTNPNSLNNSSQASTQIYSQSTNDIVQLWTERARTLDRLNRFQESVAAYDQALELRCQEQSLRINEPLPSVCENYLFPPPSANSPTPNNTNRSVIVPVSPSQQPTTPSKPNRTVW